MISCFVSKADDMVDESVMNGLLPRYFELIRPSKLGLTHLIEVVILIHQTNFMASKDFQAKSKTF